MAIEDVLLGALMVFTATMLGAPLILAFRSIRPRMYSAMLSFCAGVMAYSALEMLWQSNLASGMTASAFGMLLGMAAIFAMDKLVPHIHARIRGREIATSKRKAVLLAGAITIHNVPEGLAVASAFASSNPLGWLVATSIALQDIPEGFMTSAPLFCYGMDRWKAIFFGVFSGAVEALAAIAGYFVLTAITPMVPFALAFSAGAMLYVVIFELMPDALSNGCRRIAVASLLAGAIFTFVIACLFVLK